MDNEKKENSLFAELGNHKTFLPLLIIVLVLGLVGCPKNQKQPRQSSPADLATEAAKKEEAQQQAEIEDGRRARQTLKAQAEVEAELHRTRILGQRKTLLQNADKLMRELQAFDDTLHELLTNDDGKRIAHDPKLVSRFHTLRNESRPTPSEIAIIIEAVPDENYFQPPDLPLYAPAPSDKQKLESLRKQLTSLSDSFLHHRLELKQLLSEASKNPIATALELVLANWEQEEALRRKARNDEIARQGKIIVPGSTFYGFYRYTDSRRRKKVKKSFFTLTIQQRQGDEFNANFKLGWQDWPAEGQLDGNKVVFRYYKRKETRDERRFDRADSIFYGEIHGITLSGDFEEPSEAANPGRGDFYSQLIQNDKYMDIVNTPKDLLAPGAIWKGQLRSVTPARTEPQSVAIQVDSRNRTAFTATMRPTQAKFIGGNIDGSKLTWHVDSGNGSLVEYNATVRDGTIRGSSSIIIDGVPNRSEFHFEFDRIDQDFWADPRH